MLVNTDGPSLVPRRRRNKATDGPYSNYQGLATLSPPTFLDLLHPILRLFFTLSHQAHTVGGKQQTESGSLRGGRERVLDVLNAGQGEVTPNFHLRESIDMHVHA